MIIWFAVLKRTWTHAHKKAHIMSRYASTATRFPEGRKPPPTSLSALEMISTMDLENYLDESYDKGNHIVPNGDR